MTLKKIKSYINGWIQLFRYLSIEKEDKHITFYSEGKQYWICYKGIIDELLKSKYKIYFISSDLDDPGLHYSNDIQTFSIDEKYQRLMLFKNLNTKILITTMPDLDNFPDFPKCNKTDHYIYCLHSLMSTHFAYNEGAFDNFDIIFCCGDYQIKEIRKTEAIYNLKPKILFKHGYSKLDYLLNDAKKNEQLEFEPYVLFAPGWNGAHSLVENGKAIEYISKVIEQGYKLYFKPHPESLKRSKLEINNIIREFCNDKRFVFFDDILSVNIILHAKYLITDWSGIAIEYAFATGNYVLYIDGPQKSVNKNGDRLEMKAFEASIRKKIGYIWDGSKMISEYDNKKDIKNIMRENIFNILNSDKIASDYIASLLKPKSINFR